MAEVVTELSFNKGLAENHQGRNPVFGDVHGFFSFIWLKMPLKQKVYILN